MAPKVSEEYLKSSSPKEIAQGLNISLEAATELWRAANGFREDELIITSDNSPNQEGRPKPVM